MFCVSSPGYTWQSDMNYTDYNTQTLQDKNMILFLKTNF